VVANPWLQVPPGRIVLARRPQSRPPRLAQPFGEFCAAHFAADFNQAKALAKVARDVTGWTCVAVPGLHVLALCAISLPVTAHHRCNRNCQATAGTLCRWDLA